MFGVSLRALFGAAGTAAAVPEGYAAVVLALAPRAWWRFGETGGVGAIDWMGVAPGLYVGGVTLGRAALVDDPSDPAVRLDGASGRVEVPHVPAFATAAGTFAVALSAEDAQAACTVWSKGSGVDLGLEGNRVVFRLGGHMLKKGTVFARRRVHVAWSFGPRGMRLYVDGLLVANNPHTGGLAGNGAALLWGAGPALAQPFAGTLDEAAFFDRQLTDAEVLGLARLSRAIPAAAVVRYVAPSGNDSAPGSLAQPWRTVAKAFASANPGDVVVLRGGTYWERGLSLNRSGTASQPITLMAHPGEQPVIDGGWDVGRTVGNNQWTLVDSGRGIWESPPLSGVTGQIFGHFKDGASGDWYALLPYWSNDHFTETGDQWRGPGARGVSGRVRVRLQKPSTALVTQTLASARKPANEDPRQNVIRVGPTGALINVAASHWIFDGIEFAGGQPLFSFSQDRSHFGFYRCRFFSPRDMVVLRRNHHVLFDDCECIGGFPVWWDWVSIKAGTQRNRDGKLAMVVGDWQGGAVTHLEIRNCLLKDMFDGTTLSANHNDTIHIHHNMLECTDDACQNKATTRNVDFHHNHIWGVGHSFEGTGGTSSAAPGTTFIHHNLKMNTRILLWDFGQTYTNGCLASHWEGGYGSGTPFIMYHNTFVVRVPNLNGIAAQVQYINHSDSNNTGIPHQVFNNIVVSHAEAGANNAYALINARVQDASQIYDGNLWHRHLMGSVANPWLWRNIKNRRDGSTFKAFNSLAAFKADAFFQDTKAYYAPGWENSGVEADPQFVAPDYQDTRKGDWRPQAAAALSGIVDLTGKAWPGIDPSETQRGALKPDGATLIGRQPMP